MRTVRPQQILVRMTTTSASAAPSDPTGTIVPRTNKRYGWLPDLPDNRDKVYRPRRALRALPSHVDLRTTGFMPPVYDQGYLGSCTANAIAAAFEYEQRRQGLTDFMPGRLFIYYEERRYINALNYDSGAFIRDGLKVVNKLGAPDESLWTYDISRYTSPPPPPNYVDAEKHQAVGYAAIDNRIQRDVKVPLASGIPVVIGFTVYPWFEEPGAGGILKPVAGQPVLGGHAVLLVGYTTLYKATGSRRIYGIVRNSWGSGWGDGGYCYFPLAWLCDYANADDFWVINQVEE